MTLLENFRLQLEEIGELKRVWLTTFNLDISFVETWVLPAVLGMDAPVSRMDYEGLQHELSESGIDFRIFCDPRMIAKEKPKRTSIAVYPVSLRNMTPQEDVYLDTQNGLFHPKVFYLEGKNRKIILGAGSANLTLSGWGRNQEAVDFRWIATRTQFQQAKQFFTAIDESLRDEFPAYPKYYSDDDDTAWSFIHSLSRPTLLDALQDGGELETLSVWSPYLAGDLAGLIGKLGTDVRVKLVPDLVSGRYLRTRWNASLQALLDDQTLMLHHSPAPKDDRALMTHAKIWLAKNSHSRQLAVGSWNFTGPGCSSLPENNWNVEAGIVHPVSSGVEICGKAWQAVSEADFASDTLLEEEALQPGELPPFDLAVVFDWANGEYRITGRCVNAKPEAGYQLILPGVTEPFELVWQKKGNGLIKSPPLVCSRSDALLDNPFYTLRKAGVADWQGMINETGVKFRRALSFASLDDLLNSYLNGVNAADSDRLVLRSALGQDESQAEGETVDDLAMPEATSYFRLFKATQQRRNEFTAMSEGNPLYRALFSAPGCLLELAEIARERTEQAPESVFNWFLAQEVNSLAALARKRVNRVRREKGAESLSVAAHQWASLQVKVPALTDDIKSLNYLAAIREACEYGE